MSKTLTRYGTVLRIYDDGGKTLDRYSILPPRWATEYRSRAGIWQAIGASEYPFSPQGFGQTTTAQPGAHLGRRITWADLPIDVQAVARDVFPEYCPEQDDGPGALALLQDAWQFIQDSRL